MTIKAIIIFTVDAEIVLERNFMEYLTLQDKQQLRTRIISGELNLPIFLVGSKIFVTMKKDVYQIFVLIENQDCVAPFIFIDQFWNCINKLLYKKGQKLLEDNQLILQEILDEMIDNGNIHTADPEVIRLFIAPSQLQGKKHQEAENPTIQATKQVNYRPSNIKYDKDQIFFDINERISATFSSQNELLKSSVLGQILAKSRLSGIPSCRIKFTNGNQQNMNFHQCISVQDYAKTRAVQFVPPDGDFELLQYNLQECAILPLKINIIYSAESALSASVQVTAFSQLNSKQIIEKVTIKIPLPETCNRVEIQNVKGGKAKRKSEFIEWRVNELYAPQKVDLTFAFTCDFSDKIDLRVWKKPEIQAEFEVLQASCSGLEVKSLEIDQGSQNKPVEKWVRGRIVSGDYCFRW
ncbi:Mu adaptin [Spironucleus salmonicida]|uniref:Mu adaptin n=1 Tax=Spironucleus salmonicida TaxID=348837 RepID=V6LTI6_9EUKA|nr:Mu adaptin [Spironucleus salmonicida]|eukprot:EST47006.1 Mu adaptin [Spironucleus salmonicida]